MRTALILLGALGAALRGAGAPGPEGPPLPGVRPASQEDVARSFDDDPVEAPPRGFVFAQTRQAQPGRWLVRRDEDNGILVQLGDAARRGGFALAILPDVRFRGVELAVRLRLTGGERAGGLVWRYQDPEHYYLAVLDLAEQEIAAYRVVRGNRIRLDSEDDLELDREAWHALRVRHEGERIYVYLGGIRVFRTRDRTIREAGAVGVWSAGGSVTQFDDLEIEEERDRD